MWDVTVFCHCFHIQVSSLHPSLPKAALAGVAPSPVQGICFAVHPFHGTSESGVRAHDLYKSGVLDVLQSCTSPTPRPVAALAFGLDTLSLAGLMPSADEHIERVALQAKRCKKQNNYSKLNIPKN